MMASETTAPGGAAPAAQLDSDWPQLPPPLPSWQRAPYRVGQFLRGLTASVSEAEQRQLDEWLAPAGVTLFTLLPLDAQRHSLNVLQTLLAAGYDVPDLTQAALLHDVGKIAADKAGVRLHLWLRGPIVLTEWLAPETLVRQAVNDPSRGWRYALHVQLDHPAIGAAWAKDAGCSVLTCWLIAHHQDKTLPPSGLQRSLLAALQWADERN
jgi:hypothetical protein